VLNELDHLKKGTEPINIKTREVIRYLDRQTKTRPVRAAEGTPTGSLRIQAPEEMFAEWEDCEKLSVKVATQKGSKNEIPRHIRAMVNCVLFLRSKGKELSIVTEDNDLSSFAEGWAIATMTSRDLDNASTKALNNYRREMKAYESRKRTAARSNAHNQRSLWVPPK
jgi:hypothetical protein